VTEAQSLMVYCPQQPRPVESRDLFENKVLLASFARANGEVKVDTFTFTKGMEW